jgi:TrmH family RNA methyltransferase
LLEKKGRARARKFLLEGVHLVKEAIAAHIPLEVLMYPASRGIPDELADLAFDPRWCRVSDAVFAKCTDTVTPQSVLAVAPIQPLEPEQWLADLRQRGQHDELVLVVDQVRDPGNLGTVIRSAAAVGADGVIIGQGSVDLYSPKTVRATMGAMFRVPVMEADLTSFLPYASAAGARLAASTPAASTDCYSLDLRPSTWFLVGNEGAGLDSHLLASAHVQLRIPMQRQTESLNVAMAATVLLYEAFRQRQSHTR